MIKRIILGMGISFAAGIAAIPLRPVSADAVGLTVAQNGAASTDTDVLRPIDTSINTALRGNGLETQMTTAVVPIVGYTGSDATLRLAQVSGPQAAVARVHAVMEIDNDSNKGPWQFTSLIPVSSIVGGGRGHRVDGVGVTAIIAK